MVKDVEGIVSLLVVSRLAQHADLSVGVEVLEAFIRSGGCEIKYMIKKNPARLAWGKTKHRFDRQQ